MISVEFARKERQVPLQGFSAKMMRFFCNSTKTFNMNFSSVPLLIVAVFRLEWVAQFQKAVGSVSVDANSFFENLPI